MKPLNDIVIVKPIEEDDGPIIIPDAYKEKQGLGFVVSVGPGKLRGNNIIPLDVNVGDKVVYGKYTGEKTGIDDLLAMREDDILGVINE